MRKKRRRKLQRYESFDNVCVAKEWYTAVVVGEKSGSVKSFLWNVYE